MDKSGFLYKGHDPIFDMTKEEFQIMLSDFGFELEHPVDLVGHSLYMWRAKWVYRILRKDQNAIEQNQEEIEIFRKSLV